MKLKKIKLNSFDVNNLEDYEMNLLKGGNSCQDYHCGPSSRACNECNDEEATPTPTPDPA